MSQVSSRRTAATAASAVALGLVLVINAPIGAARQAGSAAAPYRHVATLPSILDGQPLRTFVFDPDSRRLFAASDRGLFWADLSADEPRLVGPIVRKDIFRLEVAVNIGRVFYYTDNEVGYVPAREPGNAVVIPRADTCS